jgi:lipoprotein NlpD
LRLARSIRIAGLWCVLLAGCADTGGRGPETYAVRPQDTLYSIAWRHDLDYRDLARLNHLGSDYHISVGQVLVLRSSGTAPPAATRSVVTPSAAAPPAPNAAPPGAPSRAQESPRVTRPVPLADAPAAPSVAGKWVWPTDRTSPPRPVPGGGILLYGRVGQEVRAASGGRVVYTGSGLRGYGNLIIIKHGESLLSAYAHNRELLVHEGQEVLAGQSIARMGEGPNRVAALYFELRQNGKPIDPAPLLNGSN